MSLADLGLVDVESKTLLIDGDIVIYQPCCIFNNDSDSDRLQIGRHINNKIDKMMEDAGCDKYILFVTTKFNFRDDLVDDYKANRDDVDRPVNLAWAKRWSLKNLNAYFHKGLEADDLLGIHMGKGKVIWSLDKDLRQIAGEHLDYYPDPKNPKKELSRIVTVTEEGSLNLKEWVTEEGNPRKKVLFNGNIGLYFQMLVGDSTDNIIGCGILVPAKTKSGFKRKGVGEMAAYKKIIKAVMNKGKMKNDEAVLSLVKQEYFKVHGKNWQYHLETQANLLFMVRQQRGEIIRRWTVDGRKEYFHLVEGKILTEEVYLNDYK